MSEYPIHVPPETRDHIVAVLRAFRELAEVNREAAALLLGSDMLRKAWPDWQAFEPPNLSDAEIARHADALVCHVNSTYRELHAEDVAIAGGLQ